MFLDVKYKDETRNSTEYLSLTVAKNRQQKRPEFISVIVPDNISQANGLFIKFSKSVKGKNGEWCMEMEKDSISRAAFEGCRNSSCTARFMGGYLMSEKGRTDIFQKFFDFDHALFLFVYPDGTHKSVAVPLFSFKEQYKALP